MTKLTFFIGLPENVLESQLTTVEKILADSFGGFTWTATRGAWTNPLLLPNGLEYERAAVVTVLTDIQLSLPEAASDAARRIANVLHQQEVWYAMEQLPYFRKVKAGPPDQLGYAEACAVCHGGTKHVHQISVNDYPTLMEAEV